MTRTQSTLTEKLKATVSNTEILEGNAQFFKYLEAVHTTFKKLENTVAAATST